MLVTVELIRDEAINLLSDMERLDLIKLNTPIKSSTMPDKNLSQRFAGALHISDENYEVYQNTLCEERKEWNRDICYIFN